MKNIKRWIRYVGKNKYLYLMLVPVIMYFLIFKYYPMYGSIIAFKNFKISKGIIDSDWVGLENFQKLFSNREFYNIFGNTLMLSILNLIFAFPVPIIMAVMLSEIKSDKWRKVVQTAIYTPYFITWSVMGGIVNTLLSPTIGLPAMLSKLFSITPENTIYIMGNEVTWLITYVLVEIWKNAGWGTIIYAAAITGINPELYESARIDGASKIQQIWYITIKQIRPIIVCMYILKIGKILSISFEQVYALQNNMVLSV